MSFHLANAKRQGANRLATSTTQNVKAAPSFAVARRALFEILSQYCFGKIVELVEMPATDTRLSFFHGKVLIVNNSYFTNAKNQNQNQSKPEQLFFDKAGRQKSMISIGPMKLIDTVYGHGHKNSVPQLGEILIGLKVENTNEKRSKTQPFIFRSWSMNGKVMLDLFRMVQYGTKMSDLEIRPMFRQGAGAVAQKMMDASKDSLPFEQKVSMCKCVKAVDDIYIVAKMILWGNMRLLTVLHCLQTDSTLNQTATDAEIDAASDLKLSANALEFVQGISQKLNDDSIMKYFTDSFSKFSGSDKDKEKAVAPWKPYEYDYGYGVSTKTDEGMVVKPSSPVYGGGGAASPYAPSSPVYGGGGGAASPFAPSSPMYGGVENGGGAASPMYGRTSPVHDKEKEIKIKKIEDMREEQESESNSPLAPPPNMSDSEEEEDAESPIEPPPSDTAEIKSKPSKKKSRWGDATVSQILENSLH
jgi:hypothetical protein